MPAIASWSDAFVRARLAASVVFAGSLRGIITFLRFRSGRWKTTQV